MENKLKKIKNWWKNLIKGLADLSMCEACNDSEDPLNYVERW